jgi:hypothetical protein
MYRSETDDLNSHQSGLAPMIGFRRSLPRLREPFLFLAEEVAK